ncbi:hypothetical protein FO519_000279 [Halicephalobus sp. NKZ332]|nr:hypothetical protein FO519_000279 [Halicephalobus sp. NKZ332]
MNMSENPPDEDDSASRQSAVVDLCLPIGEEGPDHRRTRSSFRRDSQAALLDEGSPSETMTSIFEDNGKTKYRSAEEILAKFGYWNPRLLFIMFSMAMIWGITAMPIMVAAFAVKGIECKDPTPECLAEKSRYYSIVQEFDLDNFWAESFFSSFFVGNMFFGTALAYFADVIGRKHVVVWSLFFTGVFGVFCALSHNFVIMLIFRILQGCLYTPTSMVNWVLASESVCFEAHGHASMVFGFFWVLGYCSIALVAFIYPNWHYMVFISSLPSLLFSIIFFFTIPESFHFLVEKGKKKEISDWIKKAERPNKSINCDVDFLVLTVTEGNTLETRGGFMITFDFLIQNKRYIFYLIASTFMWIFDIMVYNGMSLFSTTLVGNPYWNFVLSGAIEIPAYLFSPFLMNRLGRRKTVFGTHIFTALCLLPLVFIDMDHKVLYVTFWLLGKLGTSVSFISLFVYGSEIFPTQIKNTCMGVAALFGNIGGVLAYQTHELTTIYFGLPMMIFSAFSFFGGLVILGFPETATHRNSVQI